MNIPCPYKSPCIDDANSLGNFSSEDPDRFLFRSTYFRNQIWDGDDDIFTACYGLCVSFDSQAEADLCAQNNAQICEANKQYGNDAYTCSEVCPDGVTYSFTVPAGTFWSDESKAQADALAKDWCDDYITALCQSKPGPTNPNPGPAPNPRLPPSNRTGCNDAMDVYLICPDGRRGWNVPACRYWASNKAAANARAQTVAQDTISWAIGCLIEFPKTACVGDDIDKLIAPLKAPGVDRPVEWEIFGILPPGLKSEARGLTFRIYGTFATAGTYGFRVTMTDKKGLYTYRVYYISVMEIDESSPLPNGEVTVPYSQAITVLGGWDPKTWRLKSGSTLPPGLTINASTGVISGIPTAVGTYNFTIVVEDDEDGTCEKDFELEIEDNLFAAWTWTVSPTPGGCGAAAATGLGAYGTMDCSVPGSPAVCGTASASVSHLVWNINNTTGGPILAQLRVEVQKVRLSPPAPNGIQAGSETIFFRETLGAVIANTGVGALASGTYTFPFAIPPGLTNYQGLFVCQTSYSGVPYFLGGESHFQIYFERP